MSAVSFFKKPTKKNKAISLHKTIAILLGIMFSSLIHAESNLNTPKRNPYLADSPNNQSHWNDAATDSTPAAVPKGHFCMSESGYSIVPNDGLGIPAYSAQISGKNIYWFFSGTMLRKLTLENGKFTEIDRKPIHQNIPNRVLVSDTERIEQSKSIQRLLSSGDETSVAKYIASQPNRLREAIDDQVAQGVLYSLFTRDYGFIGANARGLLQINNLDHNNPLSGLSDPKYTTLPNALFNDEKVKKHTIFNADSTFGLGMTFNGFIVISTLSGKVATFDRKTLTLIDTFSTPDEDELFTNSFASSEELNGGAVYIASNRRMYRFVVDNKGKILSDEASGAWSAEYERGIRMPFGKIADGTGATPTLMGFNENEDRLVIITDGSKKMNLVAFWRDKIPSQWSGNSKFASKRIADQIEVDLGPDFPMVQSEQSVVSDGKYAFVLNSMFKPEEIKPYPDRGSYLRNLLLGSTRPLPRGIAMFEWDNVKNKWKSLWKRTDIGTVATVPMISGGSQMVVLNGSIGNKIGKLHHLGFDLKTGNLVMSISSGNDPIFNGSFTGLKTDDDGSLMYTTMMGLVRFDVTQMTPSIGADNNSPGTCPNDSPNH